MKGIDGILEVAGGVLLLVFGRRAVNGTVAFLTQHELAEDPRDWFAGLLVRHAHDIGAGAIRFAAAYLLFHGLIKIWLVWGLLRERRWIFPIALVLMALFVAYQIVRLLHHASPALAVLTALDIVIIGLVWSEARSLRRAPVA